MTTMTRVKAQPSATAALAKAGPLAPMILLAAAGLGLVAMFLPAVTVSVLGTSQSLAVFRDWRGKLDLLGYVAVAVMAATMLKSSSPPKGRVLACLIIAGVALLLAVWLPLSVGGMKSLGSAVSVSTGIGCYANILAAVAMAAGAAVLAKREKLV